MTLALALDPSRHFGDFLQNLLNIMWRAGFTNEQNGS